MRAEEEVRRVCRPRKDSWAHILRAYSAGRRMVEGLEWKLGKQKGVHVDRVVETEKKEGG